MLRQKPRRLQYATGILPRAAFRIQGFKIYHKSGRDGWIRTSECRRQRPMPYRLATPPYSFARNSFTLKITRCVRSASQGYMGWVKGLEPSTLGTTIRCSNQLSYTHHIKFATDGNGTPGGIRFSAEKPRRLKQSTGLFSRAAFRIPGKVHTVDGTPGGIRTPGLLLRRQLLYPTELLAHTESSVPACDVSGMERVMGIEPTCSAWKADILPLNYTRGSF